MKHSVKDTLKIVKVARGDLKADLVLKNCKVLDVFCEQIIEGDIAIVDHWIVGIGSYSGIEERDIEGQYVIPGFIDGHVHIESSLLTPAQFSKLVVKKGTTTVIADPHEIANVCGAAGIYFMLESSENLPIDVRIMLPSCVPSTDFEQAGAILNAEDLKALMPLNRVLGLGEMMNYPGVVLGNQSVHDKLQLFEGQLIDGHSPNLSGKALNAYVAAGVVTDHECTTVQEMEERLQLGMYVLIREGSATKNLSTLIKGVTAANSNRIAFCTDDKQPKDIMADGHINYNVNRAIELGVNPIKAIKMATINTANCYRMYDRGAIAPGYLADLLVVKDLTLIHPVAVYKKGTLVAKENECVVPVYQVVDDSLENTINIKNASELTLDLPLTSDIVRVIKLVKHNITTTEVPRKVDLENHHFKYNPKLDILKLAVIERHHQTGNKGIGLLEGYGLKRGAIALTIAHDSHNVIVIGTNDEDMKAAVKALEAMGGGMVIVDEGRVIDALRLEVAGLMTNQDAEKVEEALNRLSEIAYQMGVDPDVEPFMTLAFMALPVIPELKLTDQGLFDVKTFEFVEVSYK